MSETQAAQGTNSKPPGIVVEIDQAKQDEKKAEVKLQNLLKNYTGPMDPVILELVSDVLEEKAKGTLGDERKLLQGEAVRYRGLANQMRASKISAWANRSVKVKHVVIGVSLITLFMVAGVIVYQFAVPTTASSKKK